MSQELPNSSVKLLNHLEIEVFALLSPGLHYHNYGHTVQVLQGAMVLAKQAKCSGKEIEMLGAAAVLHDSGYGKKYHANEGVAAMLAEKMLPGYGFTTSEISQIKNMILTTNLMLTPENKLEMLLVDADLSYLGGASFFIWSDRLYKEWQYIGFYDEPSEKWLASQIVFLQNHTFYTEEAKVLFEPGKQKNLEKLKLMKSWPTEF